MKIFLKFLMLTGFLTAVAVGEASANIYTFNYSYNGSIVTPITTQYGKNLAVGDTVNEKISATNGYWTTTSGIIWPLINIAESGTRTGDAFFMFYDKSSLVYSTSLLGKSSSSVHIINNINTPASIVFDVLEVNYKLLSTNNTANHFASGFQSYASLTPPSASSAKFTTVEKVPEPASFALFGLGMAGLVAVRRRRNKT